jgi:hypothetical protein
MRYTIGGVTAFLAVTASALAPAPAHAWGFAAHRVIMARAIELLPPDLQPFYARHRDEVVMRIVDPDLWRNVGWDEDPHHFLDYGVKDYGEYPFKALPRDYDAAVEKFGVRILRENGLLPWRFAELFGSLRRTFESFARQNRYAGSDLVLFSAVASHYLQDAHQPLHATINYDGAQTGQHGVHARFERDLFERYEKQLAIAPAPAVPFASPRDTAFDILLRSYQRVPALLEADRKAAGSRKVYDDAYYRAFFAEAKPLLERCVADATTATASLLVAAWQQAGRPSVPTESRGADPGRR